MKSRLDYVRLAFAAIGVLALFAAIGAYLVYGTFELPVRILAVVAILCLGLYVAIDPEDVLRRLTTRRALYGGNTLVMAVALIGILGLLNVLATRYSQRWDLTASRQFSLSDQTIKVLQELPGPVKATVLVTPDDFRRQELDDLLKEYRSRSNGKLDYELVDPELDPTRAVQLGVQPVRSGTTVFEIGERGTASYKHQNATGSEESDLTSALIKLVLPPRKIYFTTGHGERRIDGFDENSYSQLKTALEGDNFTVETLTLAGTRVVPEDAVAVVIAAPQNPLLEDEIAALNDYLDRAGKLVILAEPQSKSNLGELLKRWNVQLGSEVVLDPALNLAPQRGAGQPAIPVVASYASSPITQDLEFTFFPVATYVQPPADSPSGTFITPLARTTDRSWATGDLQNPEYQEGRDRKGPLTLAVSIEADAPNASAPEGGEKPRARVVVFGDSDFVSNQFVVLPAANRDLFLNSVNWAVGSEQLVSIRPKPREDRTMVLTGTQMNLIIVSSVLFLPLLVLAGGAAVWWTRR